MLMLLSAGFAYGQEITVQGDKKLNTDFKKYKTYGWLTNDLSDQLVAYTYEEVPVKSSANKGRKGDVKKGKNVIIYSYAFILPSSDEIINSTLTTSVESELDGRGYRKNQAAPDMYVAYKIFDQSTKIKGTAAEPVKVGSSEVRMAKDTISYALKPGTVFISLLDAKTSSVIWEGFASGISSNNDIISDQAKVKEAINLIFKKYEFRGDKYSMN